MTALRPAAMSDADYVSDALGDAVIGHATKLLATNSNFARWVTTHGLVLFETGWLSGGPSGATKDPAP